MASRDVIFNFQINSDGAERGAKKFERATKRTQTEAAKTQKASKGLGRAFTNLGAAMAATFTVQAIVSFGKSAVNSFRNFESALASLSAITGATGQDLEFLENKAKDLAKESGIVAADVLKAFELMGSAKPELLADGEALAAVTEEAIALSQASGLELEPSIQALAGTMNQFGLPAEEASRVINALAAGSKEGSAAIPALSESMRVAGAIMSGAGLSIEESVAALEVFGAKSLQGAEAGTQFRNILLTLQSAGLGMASGTFDLGDALDEVANKNLSAAEAAKFWGRENAAAGEIIVNNRDQLERLTGAVTGTQTAYEQAAVNTATFEFATKKMNAALDLFMTEVGEAIAPALVEVAGFITEVANRSGELADEVRPTVKLFRAFGEAVGWISDKLGIATDETESASSGFNHLKTIVTNIGNPFGLIGDFIGQANDLVLSFVETGLRKLGLSEGFITVISDAFGIMGTIIEKVTHPLRTLTEGLEYIGIIERDAVTITEQLAKSMTGNVDALNAYSKEIQLFANNTGASAEELEQFTKTGGKSAEMFRVLGNRLAEGGLNAKQQSAIFREMTGIFTDWKERVSEAGDATKKGFKDAKDGGDGAATSIEGYKARLKELNDELKVLPVGTEAYRAMRMEIFQLESEFAKAVEQADQFTQSVAGIESTGFEGSLIDKEKILPQRTIDGVKEGLAEITAAAGESAGNQLGTWEDFNIDWREIAAETRDILIDGTGQLLIATIANKDAEIAALNERRDAELAAAEGNEAKQAEITKKYARLEFQQKKKQAIAEVLINAAIAVTKSLATLGFPAGLVAAIPIAAETAAQIAIISARQPGFKEGGFTGYMSASDVAGVVHGQEFVFKKSITSELLPEFKAIHAGQVPPSVIRDAVRSYTNNSTQTTYNQTSTMDDKRIVDRLERIVELLPRERNRGRYNNKRRGF